MPPPYNHDRPPTPEEIARLTYKSQCPILTPEEHERRTIEECDRIRRELDLPPYQPEDETAEPPSAEM